MTVTPPDPLKPRKTPRQARSAVTVDAVLEATIQVLLTDGFSRLTTTRVAKRAGVSVGTMYQYFPHKEALLFAVIQHYLDEVADAVEQACERNLGQPLDLASDARVQAYVDAKSVNPDVSRALYLASSDLNVAGLVNVALKRFQNAVVPLLESTPDARFEALDEVAFDLLAALTGATRVVFENGATPEMLEQFRRRMMTMARAFLRDAAVRKP
jgi:AcrR family transcriptional regulator